MEYHIERVRIGDGYIEIRYPLRKVLYRGRSEYQEIVIAESDLGKMLILDGVLQFTTYDEEIYHETLTLTTFKEGFRRVLILGGGDGGAAKALKNKYPMISIDIVDIDPEVTYKVLKYIPEVPGKVFEMEGVKLINMDAHQYVRRCKVKYDYIIGDLTDIRFEGEAGSQVNRLYTSEYISELKEILTNHGVITYHIGGYNIDKKFILDVYNIFKEVFKYVKVYAVYIPSFIDLWTFISGSDGEFMLRSLRHKIYDFTDDIKDYETGSIYHVG